MLSIVLATHNEIDHKTYITRWKMKVIRAINIIIIYLACEDISPLDHGSPNKKVWLSFSDLHFFLYYLLLCRPLDSLYWVSFK